jgi:hypothetical protein
MVDTSVLALRGRDNRCCGAGDGSERDQDERLGLCTRRNARAHRRRPGARARARLHLCDPRADRRRRRADHLRAVDRSASRARRDDAFESNDVVHVAERTPASACPHRPASRRRRRACNSDRSRLDRGWQWPFPECARLNPRWGIRRRPSRPARPGAPHVLHQPVLGTRGRAAGGLAEGGACVSLRTLDATDSHDRSDSAQSRCESLVRRKRGIADLQRPPASPRRRGGWCGSRGDAGATARPPSQRSAAGNCSGSARSRTSTPSSCRRSRRRNRARSSPR